MTGQRGFVGEMPGRMTRDKKAESRPVGGPIHDAGVGAGFEDLCGCAGDRLFAHAVEFEFPADDPRIRKPCANPRENFLRRPEGEADRAGAAVKFRGTVGTLDAFQDKIAKRSGVEDEGRRPFERAQGGRQRSVGGKGSDIHSRRGRKCGGFAAETNDIPPGAQAGLREDRADFSRRGIGDPPDIVQRFEGRTARDAG